MSTNHLWQGRRATASLLGALLIAGTLAARQQAAAAAQTTFRASVERAASRETARASTRT